MAERSVTVRITHSAPSSRFNEATAPTLDEAMAMLGYYSGDKLGASEGIRDAHWATITQLTASLAEANRARAALRERIEALPRVGFFDDGCGQRSFGVGSNEGPYILREAVRALLEAPHAD